MREWEISDLADELDTHEQVQPPFVNGEKRNDLKMINEYDSGADDMV